MQVSAGELQSGMAELELALELDPRSNIRPAVRAWLGAARFGQGQFGEPIPVLKESEQLLPALPMTYPLLAACYGHLGDRAAARRYDRRIQAFDYDVVEWGRSFLRAPALQGALLDGVAKARAQAS